MDRRINEERYGIIKVAPHGRCLSLSLECCASITNNVVFCLKRQRFFFHNFVERVFILLLAMQRLGSMSLSQGSFSIQSLCFTIRRCFF